MCVTGLWEESWVTWGSWGGKHANSTQQVCNYSADSHSWSYCCNSLTSALQCWPDIFLVRTKLWPFGGSAEKAKDWPKSWVRPYQWECRPQEAKPKTPKKCFFHMLAECLYFSLLGPEEERPEFAFSHYVCNGFPQKIWVRCTFVVYWQINLLLVICSKCLLSSYKLVSVPPSPFTPFLVLL